MSYPLFWMRYVDWFFTTPFFLLDLCLLAGACPWETFFVMLMNAICITCGAIGALKPSVNVPMFILGMITFAAFIQRLLVLPGGAHYQMVMKLTMGIWCAYPIISPSVKCHTWFRQTWRYGCTLFSTWLQSAVA